MNRDVFRTLHVRLSHEHKDPVLTMHACSYARTPACIHAMHGMNNEFIRAPTGRLADAGAAHAIGSLVAFVVGVAKCTLCSVAAWPVRVAAGNQLCVAALIALISTVATAHSFALQQTLSKHKEHPHQHPFRSVHREKTQKHRKVGCFHAVVRCPLPKG